MSAALADAGIAPALDSGGIDEVARLPASAVTHEQIIGALGRVEGLVEAEAEARQEFRQTFLRRLEVVENRTSEIAIDMQRLIHAGERKPQGAVVAIVQMLERQPLLAVVISITVLALGSGGIISIWEALTK